jgi:hypothetical protein
MLEHIYIGCGLTHVPRAVFDEYADFLHKVAESLRASQPGVDVKYALTHSDPQLASRSFDERARLCYVWDTSMVEEADLLIAEASFPSTGLGIELQVAHTKGIPIILCYRDFQVNKVAPVTYENPDHHRHSLQIGEGYISLMALGVPSVRRVLRYESNTEGVQLLTAAAQEVVSPTPS